MVWTFEAKVWTFEAEATGPEAKAFEHTAMAEIKIRSMSVRIDDELNFDCFCSDIHLL